MAESRMGPKHAPYRDEIFVFKRYCHDIRMMTVRLIISGVGILVWFPVEVRSRSLSVMQE